MPSRRRVTLRCILEDLTSGWGAPRGARTAQSLQDLLARHTRGSASDGDLGAFLRLAPPLERLDHPLIRAFVDADDLAGALTAPSVDTPAGRVASFTAAGWRGSVLLTADAGGGTETTTGREGIAWLLAAHPVPADATDGPAADPVAVDPTPYLPQDGDLLLARIERAADHREEWKTDLHRTVRSLLAEALATGDAGPLTIVRPGAGAAPLFNLTLSLERADEDEPAQVIVVCAPVDPAAEASVRVATRTVLAAIASEAVSWTAAPLPAAAMSYAASVRDCVAPEAAPSRTPGRMRVGSFAHYAPTAGLTEATLAGAPVQALCGHWFVPMHDHLTRPTCERCAALRDTLA